MAGSEKPNKRSRKTGKIVRRIILSLLLLLFLGILIFGVVIYNKYGKQILDLKAEAERIAASSSRNDFRASQTSVCYWSDGSVMSVLKGEKDVFYLEFADIPKNCINAMLATEDRKFYEHPGYDIYAILRAARAYIENDGEIRQGGSTITQQLARTIYLNNEKTVERKVKEIFLAINIEKKYTKDEILEFYINNIYFANGYYGIQAAATGYFGKTAADLSLSETAFLCGIPNSPADYNPVKRFESALKRRDSVLLQMKGNNFISEEEYEAAINEEMILKMTKFEKQDYAETFSYHCAVRELMKNEGFKLRYSFEDEKDREAYDELYEEEYYRLKRSLYTKGYRIYTSLNREKTELLQASIDEELKDYDEKNDEGIFTLQASGVCIDNETGYVVAIIGGRGQDYDGYTLNRAYQSPRQPGSSIKPLVVYTPAFETGYYPDTKVVDEKFKGGPRNSGGVYSGEIELRYAVAVSKNTVAWKIFEELTPYRGLSYLLRMGFEHIVSTDYVPAAALGGLTYGVTALEMTGAYASICNDGIYRNPTCIMRISDTEGNTLLGGYGNENDRIRIYETNAARMMTDVLNTVMISGTGRKLALNGITSAGKTGTTNEQKDGWFVGYTGYYTTGIWVGYDYPKEMKELMGNTYPGYIWHSFMEKIHEGLPDKSFVPYLDDREKDEEPEEDGSEGQEQDEDGIYEDIDPESGRTGRVLFVGEDGSRILLFDEEIGEAETDREGKPVYFDDEGNRYLYDKNGAKVEVNADGYPPDYYLPGSWTLYTKDGKPVLQKSNMTE